MWGARQWQECYSRNEMDWADVRQLIPSHRITRLWRGILIQSDDVEDVVRRER